MVSERIEDYVPATVAPEVWAQVEDRARAWASAVPTEYGRQATQRLKPLAQYLAWRIEGGLDVTDPASVFRPDHVDWFIAEGCTHLTTGTKGTYRSALRTIGEWVAGTEVACPDRALAIERPQPITPYSAHQQAALLAAISGQATGFRRHNAMALVAPSRGAGLGAADIAALVGSDIEVLDKGVVINVPGPQARRVPVLEAWESEILGLADLCGDKPLFRSNRTVVRAGDISRFCERLTWIDAPRLSVSRMRITWIVEHLAAGTPLNVLASAAGVTPESIARYARFAPYPRDEVAVRLLRRPEPA